MIYVKSLPTTSISDYKASNDMTEFKDIFFQDIEGAIPATKDGDKVALALNNPPSFLNKLRFYTIVFSYGNEWQQYLTEDEKGRLCFVLGVSTYKAYPLKLFRTYEQAKQVMDELSVTSFSNEGILQVCSFELSAVGEPSKGNPELLARFIK